MPRNPAPSIDKESMFETLYNFPKQIKEAVAIGEEAPIWRQTPVL